MRHVPRVRRFPDTGRLGPGRSWPRGRHRVLPEVGEGQLPEQGAPVGVEVGAHPTAALGRKLLAPDVAASHLARRGGTSGERDAPPPGKTAPEKASRPICESAKSAWRAFPGLLSGRPLPPRDRPPPPASSGQCDHHLLGPEPGEAVSALDHDGGHGGASPPGQEPPTSPVPLGADLAPPPARQPALERWPRPPPRPLPLRIRPARRTRACPAPRPALGRGRPLWERTSPTPSRDRRRALPVLARGGLGMDPLGSCPLLQVRGCR